MAKTSKSKLPPELTTVTPLSKMVAGALFVFLPIIAFIMGINYQKQNEAELMYRYQRAEESSQLLVPTQTAKMEAIPEEWKTYTNKKFVFEIKHPAEMTPKETTTRLMTTVLFQKDLLSLDIKPATETKDATDSSVMEEDSMIEKYGMNWKVTESATGMMYETMYKGNTYTFNVLTTDKDMTKTVDMIMSTFRFTDQSEGEMKTQ